MNLRLSMIFRPSSLMILLAYGALIVVVFLMPCWYGMFTQMERHVKLNLENIVSQLQSEIEYSAELLHLMKSSSTSLTRFMSSALALDTTNISFSDIETKVAPLLFQAFETIPFLSQISYIGMEGFFFSYYIDHNQALAMYSNSSSSFSNWGTSNKTSYYIQHVNDETGEVYGEAIATIINPYMNASWIMEAVNTSNGFASLGTKWSNGHDLLFLNSAKVTKTGVISFGFSATAITDFITRINQNGLKSYLATKDGKVLVEGIHQTHLVISNDTVSFQSVNSNGISTINEGTISCKEEAVASNLNIRDTQYLIRCYTIHIMGIESVYVLAIPHNEYVSFEVNYKKKGLTLFIIMMVMMFTALLNFVLINARATRREMHLCASLIKQMEDTQQAERKSMNKSIAVASASHDVRASLAGLTGLIEISSELVVHGSELDTNLKQMDNCTQDLLGLLNSILDISKIEAGKMQLEEEEFDVFHLVEDVVDFYHPVAMKKGVDLVLDICNGSVMRYSRVKGDRGKLKQVLCNLLSNATKFTNEGHITVRAWAQKPSVQNSIITSNQYDSKKCLSCLFSKTHEAHEHLEPMNSIQQNPLSMDFIFEVDDTGKGIPKENHKSVFENYVQVKETALGQGGTGLGLGIVQSLVRLMHGDIGIVDKDIGEKGTCFRFNVVLSLCESETTTDSSTRECIEYGSGDINQAQGRGICSTSPGSSFHSMSSRLNIFSSSTKPEASRVVLLIADEERRRTSRRFMQSLGIKVKVVKQWNHLSHTLNKIKQKSHHSSGPSSPGYSSDLSSRTASHTSLARASIALLSATDATEFIIPSVLKKTDIGAAPGFILIVVDANAGPFSELYGTVSNFKKDLHNPCKVVWLDKPLMRSINFKTLDQDDIVISKPFHGTRLIQVIKLLPEYGGTWKSNPIKCKRESTHDRATLKTWKDSRLSKYKSPLMDISQVLSPKPSEESTCQSFEHVLKGIQQSKARPSQVHEGEMMQECGNSRCHKPLSGKKFLVVDDSELLRKLASATLTSLGATIEQCENGEQAVKLVDEGLTRDFPDPPYDYILMDCQMPVMDGLEATKWIRKMEKPYGVRIPIIALTAQTDKITTEAGIDFHVVKPIKRDHLLEAIGCIDSKA